MVAKTTAVDARRIVACLLLCAWSASAGAAQLLEFEFERKGQRYTLRSESYIDVPPQGVFNVLSDYDGLHRISSLIVESRDLGAGPDGEHLVFTNNSGCLAFFCKSVKKVERLEVQPPNEIVTIVVPERSEVSYSRSRWVLEREGRGTHLSYSVDTEISFWVPPMIGNYLLRRWLRKGAKEALTFIEYYAWHSLYSEPAQTGPL